MKYILRRIIPPEECPGTCCKVGPCFPDENGVCPYLRENVNGRHSECTIFSKRPPELSDADYQRWIDRARDWPVPNLVKSLDIVVDSKKGRNFYPDCECFHWEIVADGD